MKRSDVTQQPTRGLQRIATDCNLIATTRHATTEPLDVQPGDKRFTQVVVAESTAPSYDITFRGKDGVLCGTLDFNGDEMTFTGKADESAKVFFDCIAQYFAGRLADERQHALSETRAIEPPTDEEISAYRDLFRRELDKRMDTKHPSASPSTESHAIALRAFVAKRNVKLAER